MVDIEAMRTTLSEYNFIMAVDASGSMSKEDMPNNRSRWQYMQETAEAFARDISKIDSDGIGLVVFSGANVESWDNVDANKVSEIFQGRSPRGGTPMAEALLAGLKLASKSDKKAVITIFTDGEPDDKSAVAQVIRTTSNKLKSDDELTFLFVQVGRDPGASAYLRKLDDDLSGCQFDIVDAKTIDEAEKFGSTVELIMEAIND